MRVELVEQQGIGGFVSRKHLVRQQRLQRFAAQALCLQFGAGFLAGVAVGTWNSLGEAVRTWSPRDTVTPTGQLDRETWRKAVSRAAGWIPELSGLDF